MGPHSIIYIHGITTPGGLQETEGWKTKIPEIAPPNSSLREFDLKTKLGDTFNAHIFLRKSSELLRDVFLLHEHKKVIILRQKVYSTLTKGATEELPPNSILLL
jgi:hypothetical protein